MPKEKRITKRRQVRRCAVCLKIGHNRSTCPLQRQEVVKAEQTTKQTPPMQKANKELKFFVHHVNSEPKPSKHIVNLKKHNIWNDVESFAPTNDNDSIYHYYHQIKTEQPQRFKQKIKPTKFNEKSLAKKINFSTNTKKEKRFGRSIKSTPSNIVRSVSNRLTDIAYHMQQWQKIYFPLRRTVISLAIFTLIIFAPTHAQSYYRDLKLTASNAANDGISGFSSLQESTKQMLSGDLDVAQKSLSVSLDNFNNAVEEINSNHKWLQSILGIVPIVRQEIKSRQNLIDVGYDISMANSYIIRGLNEIENSPSSTILQNMDIAVKYLNLALPHYTKAQENLNNTDSKILPDEYQTDFNQFKKLFNAYTEDLQKIADSSEALNNIFGGSGYRKYLLVFQNQNEMRPTGGFIGSFALMEVENGELISLSVPPGGSYDLQGQLEKFVEPPEQMLPIIDRWHFRDANWFADFPTSAKKLMWFYRHSRQVSTDGVIAINAEVLSRVLNITGPIKDEKRNVVLTSSNAIDTIQDIVENGEEKAQHKPKQILSDMAPKFIDQFKNLQPQDTIKILGNLQQAMEQKEIQAYFVDEKPKQLVKKLGWDGSILKTDNQDYLMVVNSNIGGQKSDAKIEQTISHEAVVQNDGDVVVTVTIERTHKGQVDEPFYGAANIDYLRIYVPQKSNLLRAGGFTMIEEKSFKAPLKIAKKDETIKNIEKEIGYDALSGTKITDEMGKTAFGNWVVTKPGKTTKVYFTYKLPFSVFDKKYKTSKKWYNVMQNNLSYSDYQLVIQKQSGMNSKLESMIIYPNAWHPTWYNGEQITVASNGIMVKNNTLNKDKVWSVMMEK